MKNTVNTSNVALKNNFGMTAIGAIFFIFGFATTFIITLSGKVKDIFEINEFTAQLLNTSFFISYLILSIPIGLLIKKIGYKNALIAGLLLMSLGSFIFFPAAKIVSFEMFLLATFILASGVVFLQIAANPYVSVLGSEETASGRLNLVQALNSIATMVAPWCIAFFIFKDVGQMLDNASKAQAVQMPFLLMGIIVFFIALALFFIRLPEISKSGNDERKSVWGRRHLLLGAVGIFFYVGAEVGVGALIMNYLSQTMGISQEVATKYVAIYWGGAMVGRFFGAISLSQINDNTKKILYVVLVLILALVSGAFSTGWNWNVGLIFMLIAIVNYLLMALCKGNASRVLAVFAAVAMILALTTMLTTGKVALWAVISIGMFNSVMFPNIFTLAIKNLSSGELSTASGILNMMIFGGAIIPPIMGLIADKFDYKWAFVIPAICYFYILFYAIEGKKIKTTNSLNI